MTDHIAAPPRHSRAGLVAGIVALGVFVAGTIADAGTPRPSRALPPPAGSTQASPQGNRCPSGGSFDMGAAWGLPLQPGCAPAVPARDDRP